MGLFSRDTEDDALKQIEKINREMREISASIHLNYDQIDGRNRSKIRNNYNNIVSYYRKYNHIKSNLMDYERGMLLGATVSVWNGETVGVIMWETYLEDTMHRLYQEINY